MINAARHEAAQVLNPQGQPAQPVGRAGATADRPAAQARARTLLEDALAHQEAVYADRRLAALGNRPHYQRLAARHVARGEHPGYAGFLVRAGRDVAPSVELDPEIAQETMLFRPDEAHGQQYQVSR